MSKKSFNKIFNELTQGNSNLPFKRIYSTNEIIKKTLQSLNPSSSYTNFNKHKTRDSLNYNSGIKREMTSLSYIIKSNSVCKEGYSNRPIVNINKKRLDFSPNTYLSHYLNKRVMITSNIVRKYAKNINSNTKKKKSNPMRQLLLMSPNEKNNTSYEKYIKELTDNTASLRLMRSEYY